MPGARTSYKLYVDLHLPASGRLTHIHAAMTESETVPPTESFDGLRARQVWLWWVLASLVGWALGGPVGVNVGSLGSLILTGYLAVAGGGLVAGGLQSLVLRRQVWGSSWWVLVSHIKASGVAGVVISVVSIVVDPDVGWVVGVGLFGTVLGTLQWVVLRRYVTGAGWWVVASTLGWVLGGAATAIVGPARAEYVGWAVLGAVYGVVTGCALVWLLRRPVLTALRGD